MLGRTRRPVKERVTGACRPILALPSGALRTPPVPQVLRIEKAAGVTDLDYPGLDSFLSCATLTPVAGHWRTLVLLAAVSSAAGLDLTTFRASYQHERRLDWVVDFSALLSDELHDTSLSRRAELYFQPVITLRDKTLSDDLEWNAEVSAIPRIDLYSDLNSEDRGNYSLKLQPALARSSYLFRTDLFIRTDLSGSAGWTEGRESHLADSVRWRLSSTELSASGNATLGLGFGRVRDARPLLKAARVVELLRSEGVLRNEPGTAELAELAAFFSRSWRFSFAHDRSAQFYYDSLVARLQELGAVRGALPARSLFRLDEDLFVGDYSRPFGWKVNAYVKPGADGTIKWWKSSLGASDTGRYGSYDLSCGTEAEYARPFGLNWLVTSSVTYSFDPGESTWTIVPDVHQVEAEATVSWQSFNRLALGAGPRVRVEHLRFDFMGWEPTTDLRVSAVATAEYFVAELLQLRVELSGYTERFCGPDVAPWYYGTSFRAGLELGRTLQSRY